MVANFLQGLTPEWLAGVLGGQAPQASPIAPPAASTPIAPPAAAPGLTPEWFAGVMGQQPDANILQTLNGGANVPPEVAARQPRERRSVLDTIGGLADVFAKVGGAEALYQPTLDARQDRNFAIQDRQRQIELEPLRRQMLEQQVQGGALEIENAQRSRLGQALGALVGNPNAAAMWPQLAQQAGLDEQQTAQIGALIEQNPGMVGPLAASFGFAPQSQGSQAKELQIYAMLNRESPELGKAYLQSLSNPDSMTPYQVAQLGIAQQRLGLDREKFVADQRDDAAKPARETPGQKAADTTFGKEYADYVAQGGYADVQKGVQQLREARRILEEGGVTGGPTGYLPTPLRSLVNERSVSVQEAIEEVVQRNLRVVLGAQFTQKEGERLIERSFNPRLSEKENIKRLDRLITQIERAAAEKESASRYFEENGTLQGWRGKMPTASDFGIGSAPQRRPAPRQAPARQAPQQRVPSPTRRPAAPKVGTVQSGYRFKGGNPADKANWEKVI